MYIFEVATFFLAYYFSNQPHFFYKIHVFDEAFFALATTAMTIYCKNLLNDHYVFIYLLGRILNYNLELIRLQIL